MASANGMDDEEMAGLSNNDGESCLKSRTTILVLDDSFDSAIADADEEQVGIMAKDGAANFSKTPLNNQSPQQQSQESGTMHPTYSSDQKDNKVERISLEQGSFVKNPAMTPILEETYYFDDSRETKTNSTSGGQSFSDSVQLF